MNRRLTPEEVRDLSNEYGSNVGSGKMIGDLACDLLEADKRIAELEAENKGLAKTLDDIYTDAGVPNPNDAALKEGSDE